MNMIKTLSSAGIIPVIVIEDISKAVGLARALVKGGLPVLEVTFRTACAADAIKKIKAEVEGATLIAGTVLTIEQLKSAREAGAEACVAPGFDPMIVNAAKEIGMPFCPGVATASELSQALSLGCKMVKFFPAESAGGVKMNRPWQDTPTVYIAEEILKKVLKYTKRFIGLLIAAILGIIAIATRAAVAGVALLQSEQTAHFVQEWHKDSDVLWST